MTHYRADARRYSAGEIVSDAAVHLGALGAALAAVPVLITLSAVWEIGALSITGLSIYGGSLILMLLCSFLYNHVPRQELTTRLRVLDQGAIFVKIAGTYTPFALLSGTGFGLLGFIWGGALAGVVLSFLRRDRSVLPGAILCLVLGWAIVLAGQPLLETMSTAVVALMVAGGLTYSLGVPFLLSEKMRFHNTIWHAFVVVGSVLFFIAIFVHLAQIVFSAA